MTLDHVKDLFRGRRFNAMQVGNIYSFTGENKLRVSGASVISVNYTLYEEDGHFYLNAPIPSSDFEIDVISQANPLTILLTERNNNHRRLKLEEMSS